ncbi:hypothetical protein JCM19231_4881 [Vibrio ishigakensis]|uniref:SCP domain-containing protein n=1 Tax=Vibrio ishigakensis TaxID=1481914 RepID=A0A0B8NWZ2_9VIBR|nr:CAP domain-containing protein [Vibrio ishigakensis]GAM58421.1 hypothetical protein JCM19231_4881 [Vibrio ishigakensis]
MRLLILPLISVFLWGCGSSSNESSTSNSNPSDTTMPDSGSSETPIVPSPPAEDSEPVRQPDANFADQMLQAVNAKRATTQICGSTEMPAVPALTWDHSLEAAAFAHSSDMANGDFLSHTGSDGNSPSDRISAQGYTWSAWAENVAAGQFGIDAVMNSWMASEGHCKNIMSANVTQMGASFVENSDTRYGIYWTQAFARPR